MILQNIKIIHIMLSYNNQKFMNADEFYNKQNKKTHEEMMDDIIIMLQLFKISG